MAAIDRLRIDLPDEAATARLAEDIAMILVPGDVIALDGDLGAGKTTFARALLRTLADNDALEVPSPTFTLVQPYDFGRLRVAHLDLYRIEEPEELDELGLDDMLNEAVVLVEWPQRARDRLPDDALWLALTAGEAAQARVATLTWSGEIWGERVARTRAIRAFLDKQDWKRAVRRLLQGDASARSYETVNVTRRHAIVMNAPVHADGPPVRDGLPYSRIAHLAEDVRPFVAIAMALRARGFAAPQILAADLDTGLLLLEDLGRGKIAEERTPIAERYHAAARLLADFHDHDWPTETPLPDGSMHRIPAYDRRALMIEAELYLDWYVREATGAPAREEVARSFRAGWNALFDLLEEAPKTWVMRDYHSPNLIWREDRQGNDRLGLIDFQDAAIGPQAYDLASLAQDARVILPPDLEAALIDAYVEIRRGRDPSFDEAGFRRDYAIMAAHRATKVIGIFTRLALRDEKPRYLPLRPQLFDYLARALSHPALCDMKHWYDRFAPR